MSIFRRFLGIVVTACLLAVPPAGQALEEGKEYARVPVSVPPETPGRIEVIEFFWYGCPHCYHLEPHVEQWVSNLPDDVVFRRVPAVLGPSWEPLARAYVVADLLGVLDRIHKPLFDRLHKERKRIRNLNELREFFVEQAGVDPKAFDQTYNSFAVVARINRAKQLGKRFGITGVPAFVINGKYRTSVSMAGGEDRLFEVIDALVDRERKALASQEKTAP